MAQINIKESLNELDKRNDCKYNLRTLYEGTSLSIEQKKELAKLLANKSPAKKVYNFLIESVECEKCDLEEARALKHPNIDKLVQKLNADNGDLESLFRFKVVDYPDHIELYDANEQYNIDYDDEAFYLAVDAADEFGFEKPKYDESSVTKSIRDAVKKDFGKDAYPEWQDSVRMVIYPDTIGESIEEAVEEEELWYKVDTDSHWANSPFFWNVYDYANDAGMSAEYKEAQDSRGNYYLKEFSIYGTEEQFKDLFGKFDGLKKSCKKVKMNGRKFIREARGTDGKPQWFTVMFFHKGDTYTGIIYAADEESAREKFAKYCPHCKIDRVKKGVLGYDYPMITRDFELNMGWDELVYDDAVTDSFKDVFDVMTPQEVADATSHKVRHGDKVYEPKGWGIKEEYEDSADFIVDVYEVDPNSEDMEPIGEPVKISVTVDDVVKEYGQQSYDYAIKDMTSDYANSDEFRYTTLSHMVGDVAHKKFWKAHPHTYHLIGKVSLVNQDLYPESITVLQKKLGKMLLPPKYGKRESIKEDFNYYYLTNGEEYVFEVGPWFYKTPDKDEARIYIDNEATDALKTMVKDKFGGNWDYVVAGRVKTGGDLGEEVLTEKPSPDGYSPKKTGKAYKVFKVKNGKLYPPKVANPGGADTPIGVWLDAEEGEFAGLSKTGRPQVKSIDIGNLSYRPGWHLGDVPRAPQFDRKNKKTGEMEFPKDFVWAECDYAMDVDYQPESDAQGYMRTKVDDQGNVSWYKSDKYQHSLAGLPKLPKDGYYKYRTNPRPDTVPWVITGQMRVNRLLSDDEVNEILKSKGIEPIHRQGGDKTLAELGLE